MEAGMNKQNGKSEAAKKSPEELENDFVRHTAAILIQAPTKSLKVKFCTREREHIVSPCCDHAQWCCIVLICCWRV